MGSFIICTGIALVLAIIISAFKLLMPEESYEMRISLILGIIAILIFAFIFLALVFVGSWNAIGPMLYCLLFCFYIYMGAKSVAFKTATGVFSQKTNNLVGSMGAGLNWADPIFEKVTANVDGVPNVSIDLQQLEIEILETPEMHTSTRGIKAKVKNVVMMLEVIQEEIPQLFEIEGGTSTVEERITSYINFFFLDEIGKIKPVDLDEDKGNTLKVLAKKLRTAVNRFCRKNLYPYEIPKGSIVTIGDTELEPEYYKFLAKKEFALLENQAKDIDAEKLKDRIIKFGQDTLPNASEKEQKDYALIALSIVKKDIQEKKYSLDTDLVQLAKDIALYFKK